MKLRLGDTLIETDYIEIAERVSFHTVKLIFTSGAILDVHCGVKSNATCSCVRLFGKPRKRSFL